VSRRKKIIIGVIAVLVVLAVAIGSRDGFQRGLSDGVNSQFETPAAATASP
jgi:DMSO/TMAO reductase YedYZ heme-binding membrane subunit